MIWAGDFNRHHLLWDRDEDTHLFTRQAQRAAEKLIDVLAEYDMTMALLKGIPTLQHMQSKCYSCPDNLFCSLDLQDSIIKCDVVTSLRPTCTDHFPIVTLLTIPQAHTPITTNLNFRDVDWEAFHKVLKEKLASIPDPETISTGEQLKAACDNLTSTIQATIASCVKRSAPRPDSKRWWSRDLTKTRKELNRLRTDSYRYRVLPNHPSHSELRKLSNTYGEVILCTKR